MIYKASDLITIRDRPMHCEPHQSYRLIFSSCRSLRGGVHRAPNEPTSEFCQQNVSSPCPLPVRGLEPFPHLHGREEVEDGEEEGREGQPGGRGPLPRRQGA